MFGRSLHVTCGADGRWSELLPYDCVSIECPSVEAKPHSQYQIQKKSGNVNLSAVEYGDQVTYYCVAGYEVGDRGNATFTCSADGRFDRPIDERLCQR